MSLDPAVLRALRDAGATVDMIIAAVEADALRDEARRAAKRAGNAERQARFRQNRKSKRNEDNALQPVTERDPSPNDIYSNPQPIPQSAKADSPPLAEKVVSAWNEMASNAGLPASRALNPKRRAALKARIAEHGEPAVFEAIRNLGNSPFHCGSNDRSWKADLGWLLTSPEKFQKILELTPAPPRAPAEPIPIEKQIATLEDRAAGFRRLRKPVPISNLVTRIAAGARG